MTLLWTGSIPISAQYEGGYGRGDHQVSVINLGLNGLHTGFLFHGGVGKGDYSTPGNAFILNGERFTAAFSGGHGRSDHALLINHIGINSSPVYSVFRGGIGQGNDMLTQQTIILNGNDCSIFFGGRGKGDIYSIKNAVLLDGNYPGALSLGGTGRSDFTLPKKSVLLDGEDLNGITKGGAGRGDWSNNSSPFSQSLDDPEYNPYHETLGACNLASLVILSLIEGSTYQWQYSLDSFNTYNDIFDNDFFSGANSQTLLLTNIPSLYSGYQFRCVVDGEASNLVTLRFTMYWNGEENMDWHDAANWNCIMIPDQYTEVTIPAAFIIDFPELNSDGICKTLSTLPGAMVTIKPGKTLQIVGPQ